MKRCSKCGQEKELSAYSKNSKNVDSLENHCRQCQSDYAKERRQNNPDLFKKQKRREYDKMKSDPILWERFLQKCRVHSQAHQLERTDIVKRSNKKRLVKKLQWKSRTYHADPCLAARWRAKASLARSIKVSQRALPDDLVEAKAAQLMVHRYIIKGK